jgi:hypothetical protein
MVSLDPALAILGCGIHDPYLGHQNFTVEPISLKLHGDPAGWSK